MNGLAALSAGLAHSSIMVQFDASTCTTNKEFDTTGEDSTCGDDAVCNGPCGTAAGMRKINDCV